MKLKAFIVLTAFIVLLVNVSFCQVKKEDLYPSPEKLRVFLTTNLKYKEVKMERSRELTKAVALFVAGLVITSLIYLTAHTFGVLNKMSVSVNSLSKFFDGFTITQFYKPPKR